MLLNLTVQDAHHALRGVIRLRLDWGQKSWFVEEDPQMAWLHVGYNRRGLFEPRDNGVIWIWDQDGGRTKRTPLIVWNAPKNPSDIRHHVGEGRIYDPKDPSFKEGHFRWTTDKIKSASNVAPIRQKILDVLASKLPGFPAEPKEPPNCVATESGSNYAGVTNCGALPGWVVRQIPGLAGLVPDKMKVEWNVTDKEGKTVHKKDYAVVTSPMTAWEQFAQYVERRLKMPGYLWVPYTTGSAKRPKPGDIYVLGKSASPRSEFAHVGIIVSATGSDWRTADAGQGAGFAVGYRKRVFDPKQGSITLILHDGHKLPPDKGTRYLKGWVDVEHLFRGWRG